MVPSPGSILTKRGCMKDLFGYELKAGDFIAVGMRQGNSGRLGAGKVLEVESERIKYLGIDGWMWKGEIKLQQKPAWLHDSTRIVVLLSPPEELVNLFCENLFSTTNKGE